MRLRLLREPSVEGATLGSLYIDRVWQCWSLEDAIREQPGQPVANWKVAGQTAIPSGHYALIITPSQRFLRPLPLLVDVPGFTGIRIHPGNTAENTEGCLLVGRDRQPGRILQSRAAFEALFARLEAALDPISIQIENPGA